MLVNRVKIDGCTTREAAMQKACFRTDTMVSKDLMATPVPGGTPEVIGTDAGD
jgi:hypothetical protein